MAAQPHCRFLQYIDAMDAGFCVQSAAERPPTSSLLQPPSCSLFVCLFILIHTGVFAIGLRAGCDFRANRNANFDGSQLTRLCRWGRCICATCRCAAPTPSLIPARHRWRPAINPPNPTAVFQGKVSLHVFMNASLARFRPF